MADNQKTAFNRALERAALRDARTIFNASIRILPPLYLSFWVLDVIYSSSQKWLFLGFRVTMVLIAHMLALISRRSNDLVAHYWLGILYAFFAANFITLMIYLTDGPSSPYYAGLNLVGLAAIWFVPFNRWYTVVTIAAIYGPYFMLPFLYGDLSYRSFFLNDFFIVGSLTMAVFIRYAHKLTRDSEIDARFRLREEVRQREQIIKVKTDEAVSLQRLSSQFSPQVVRAIRSGSIQIEGEVKRARIAALFVDIVGSTDRVVNLERENFDIVLQKFVEETYAVLLKYDLTIDKFLGDGILAFSNEPVKRSDFVQRTCYAALEIQSQLASQQDFFDQHWQKHFEVRVGISVGFANVGFYGSSRYYKTYTAIGRPLAMAARLCAMAEPSQILIDGEVQKVISAHNFISNFLGKVTIRGFEGETANTHVLLAAPPKEFINSGIMTCPACGANDLVLEETDRIYYMKCRSCEHILRAAA